jgi:hypothetical protein
MVSVMKPIILLDVNGMLNRSRSLTAIPMTKVLISRT